MYSAKLGGCLLILLTVFAAGTARAVPAVVSGTQLLYVREGPGTDYPVVSTLPKGEKIQAGKLVGKWAGVRLPDGRSGYVRAKYLRFPSGPPAVSVSSDVSPAGSVSGDRDVAGKAAAVPVGAGEAKQEHGAFVAQDRGPVAGEIPNGAADSALRADVARLLGMTEEIRERVLRESAPPKSRGENCPPSGGGWIGARAWMFGIGGLVLGMLVGSVFGRRKEGQRRSRIRF